MRPQLVMPASEELLLDYVERLSHHREDRRAVHLYLSALRPHNRRDHHIRIAINTFEPLLRKFDGRIFRLRNDDLFVFVRGATVAEVDEVVLKLRFLFSDDPLLCTEEGGASSYPKAFCTWYEIEADYWPLLSSVRHIAENAPIRSEPAVPAQAQTNAPAQASKLRPLDPATLARLEISLRTMDLRTVVRRQAVSAVFPKTEPRHIFDELFVSTALLRKTLVPGIDLTSDRWLFQRLTETLDLRVLALLPGIEAREPTPTCINLNVSTLLAPEFLAFDKALRQKTHKVVVFELQSMDVFGDIGAFMFARDFVRERGYRLTLDGLSHLSFPLIDRAGLGFDFQKIYWSPDIVNEMQPERRAAFREAIQRTGPNRVILCRCGSADAIAFGHEVGITLFQGSYVDRLMAEHAPPPLRPDAHPVPPSANASPGNW